MPRRSDRGRLNRAALISREPLAVKPLDKAMEVQGEYAKMAHQVINPTHKAFLRG
jgi:hypothetical protein